METGDYFNSYNDLEVHKIMLLDSPRNQAYKRAIFDNKDQIKDKVVLDIGCGTGILSIYCAQAGAAKVYAVEASGICEIAKEIIQENNFENIIVVINQRIEDVELPSKVDVIISEWMGFYLFHEGMLNSVISARDRFLTPQGLMFPESATLLCAPCSIPSHFEKWCDIDGVSMKSFGEKLRIEASKKPLTDIVSSEHILSDPETVTWINLKEVTIDELKEIKTEHLTVSNKFEPVVLSTGPDDLATHWKQTVVVLPSEIDVEIGTPIAFNLNLTALESNDFRRYNIEVIMLDPDEVEHPEYCPCYLTKCIVVKAMIDKYQENSEMNK